MSTGTGQSEAVLTVSGEPSCSILTEKAGPVLVISVTAPLYILARVSIEAHTGTILRTSDNRMQQIQTILGM